MPIASSVVLNTVLGLLYCAGIGAAYDGYYDWDENARDEPPTVCRAYPTDPLVQT